LEVKLMLALTQKGSGRGLALLGVLLIAALPTLAHTDTQYHGKPPYNSHDVDYGYAPTHGPSHAPRQQNGAPAPQYDQNRDYRDDYGHPNVPHVHGDNRWIGHDSGRNDPRFHLDNPWEHGHYAGVRGGSHYYQLEGGRSDRFWFGGNTFQVAPVDYRYSNDWRWDRDQVAIYNDPDHIGWYLGYNVRLGSYLHLTFLGRH
jgi:hypothetical protein